MKYTFILLIIPFFLFAQPVEKSGSDTTFYKFILYRDQMTPQGTSQSIPLNRVLGDSGFSVSFWTPHDTLNGIIEYRPEIKWFVIQHNPKHSFWGKIQPVDRDIIKIEVDNIIETRK